MQDQIDTTHRGRPPRVRHLRGTWPSSSGSCSESGRVSERTERPSAVVNPQPQGAVVGADTENPSKTLALRGLTERRLSDPATGHRRSIPLAGSPLTRLPPLPNPHSAPPAPSGTTSTAPVRMPGTPPPGNPASSAPGRTATDARSRDEGTPGHRASVPASVLALRLARKLPPSSSSIANRPRLALRRRTLDVRTGQDVGPAVRTRRRQRQSHVDRELRTAAQARPRHRLSTRRIHRRKMRPPVAGCRSPLHRHALDVVRQDSLRREYTMTCSASTSVFFTHRAVYARLYGSSTKPPVTG